MINYLLNELNLTVGSVIIMLAAMCISIREGIAEFGGLVIANKERFDLFFAAVVGSGWQGIWKVVLTAGESLAVNKR